MIVFRNILSDSHYNTTDQRHKLLRTQLEGIPLNKSFALQTEQQEPPLLILTFTSAAFSPRLLEIGIHLQILSFLLLKEQKTLLLSSLLL